MPPNITDGLIEVVAAVDINPDALEEGRRLLGLRRDQCSTESPDFYGQHGIPADISLGNATERAFVETAVTQPRETTARRWPVSHGTHSVRAGSGPFASA